MISRWVHRRCQDVEVEQGAQLLGLPAVASSAICCHAGGGSWSESYSGGAGLARAAMVHDAAAACDPMGEAEVA